MNQNCYRYNPLNYNDLIPIFCRTSEYIQNYDLIAHTHVEAIHNGVANPWCSTDCSAFQDDTFINVINRFVNSTSHVHDAGVALGETFQKLNVIKYGVDISIDYLRIAKERNINVCLSMLETLPYKLNYFDAIICKDVLEHVLDFNMVIWQFRKILKPGGYLILQVPYRQDLKGYVSYTEYKYVHLRSFDEWSLMLQFDKIFGMEYLFHNILSYNDSSVIDVNFMNMVIRKKII